MVYLVTAFLYVINLAIILLQVCQCVGLQAVCCSLHAEQRRYHLASPSTGLHSTALSLEYRSGVCHQSCNMHAPAVPMRTSSCILVAVSQSIV